MTNASVKIRTATTNAAPLSAMSSRITAATISPTALPISASVVVARKRTTS
jgi:hypothetical protein